MVPQRSMGTRRASRSLLRRAAAAEIPLDETYTITTPLYYVNAGAPGTRQAQTHSHPTAALWRLQQALASPMLVNARHCTALSQSDCVFACLCTQRRTWAALTPQSPQTQQRAFRCASAQLCMYRGI